jgi:signal transduction histidine kinase
MKSTIQKTKGEIFREKAEELIKQHNAKRKSNFSESETYKLIHELEVHQLELELQNEELIRAKERASIAEEKYIELYDFAPCGYFTLTKAGLINELNFCAARLLNKDRSHLVNASFVYFISEETRSIFNFFFQKILRSHEKESCEVVLSIEGSLPIDIHIDGIMSKKGELCFLTVVDISERKLAEKNFLALEKAEERDRLKTIFIQNMSHEIRTPMNAILGFSQLIADNFNDKSKLTQFVNIIVQNGEDLLNTINDILNISSLESGQIKVNLEACNLNQLFDEITMLSIGIQNRLGKQHIKFSLHTICDPKMEVIETDKIKLKQIFINLIGNAFKFTSTGRIDGGCRYDNNHNLLFYVSDTGIGIPDDKQSIIFDRFTQLDEMHAINTRGTGLGLSIVKGLVELLGGEIWVESEYGKGSTFFFIFPFKIIKTN